MKPMSKADQAQVEGSETEATRMPVGQAAFTQQQQPLPTVSIKACGQ